MYSVLVTVVSAKAEWVILVKFRSCQMVRSREKRRGNPKEKYHAPSWITLENQNLLSLQN